MNKEKLINALRDRYKLLWDKITQSTNSDKILYLQAKLFEVEDWIEKIENGDFDND
ncbi:hypothetical protein [Spiroplasma endosymbiont of Danaus chrysippus]|uniref:hypothetical protein n=1 Tax=Spiroplasma endosymbiont of Danaus chrysippus TaxID=2691041 RepID=UPI0013C87A5C|nr:hypothetical protein [Spiroplasma endosymbiont of Danaus chrysippus]CAB1053974.1 hypothetical protein [Spiroplasma endosymbiont of Danaus chrysippus]CAB1054092.1 hypothetical protein [Spiroplasma endosymbiont of Danaus chrysippus]CAB1054759.1 hypothetical protein [Spiroplasma endosymbiont of Danaus chrysippus]